jgi:type IV pilus assembly protein PilV
MRSDRQNGFTLVEVLIALVVFSVGLVALALMQTNATTYNGRARNLTSCIQVAEAQIDRIKNGEYAAFTDSDGDGDSGLDDVSGSDYTRTSTIDGIDYAVHTNVSNSPSLANAKRIRVIVKRPNSDHQVAFDYLLTEER